MMEVLNNVTSWLNSVAQFLQSFILVVSLLAIILLAIKSFCLHCKKELLTTKGPEGIRVFFNCKKVDKAKIMPIINKLPPALCWLFAHDKYQICVLSHKEYLTGPWLKLPNTVGLFDSQAKMIFIDAERPIEELTDTIYHELGHYCDWVAGNYIGFGGEFDLATRSCYEKMRDNDVIPLYYRSSIVEFVAYCTSHAMCSPQTLSQEMFEIGQGCFQRVYGKTYDLTKKEKG